MSRVIPPLRIFSTESTAVQGKVIQTVTVNTNMPCKNEEKEEETVKYNPYKNLKTRDLQTTSEVQILELILNAYMSNPLVINQYIIMTTDRLADLIKTMTQADNVEIQVGYDVTCCGQATNYNLVDAIIVMKDETRSDFQVAYNDLYRKLNDYRISLKWTTDA
jgi:hypothetical protein